MNTSRVRRIASSAGPRGTFRFVVYLLVQFAVFSAPFPWIAIPFIAIAALGWIDSIGWIRWISRSWGLLVVSALPAVTGIPWVPVLSEAGAQGEFFINWAPALQRSARLALVLASAAWLSFRMSPIELRDALVALLRPLGRRISGRVARAASLTMAFIPWTRAELRHADEAARLRGSDPRRHPGRHLAIVSVPLVARSLEKARRGAEALSLRDRDFAG